MFLICYKKVFGSEKDAKKELTKVQESATDPKVIKGKIEGCWLVQMYETNRKERLEEGIAYYRNKGLEVFRYER